MGAKAAGWGAERATFGLGQPGARMRQRRDRVRANRLRDLQRGVGLVDGGRADDGCPPPGAIAWPCVNPA
jgi:hypothetical protein